MALLFSTDSSNFMSNSENEIKSDSSEIQSEKILEERYELYKCCDWIETNNYKKIALQFPDDHLCNSFRISLWLEKKTERQYFVLGDTTYGSCCVDEIAAEHVSADAIIHFGRTCLSKTTRVPVLYILLKEPIDPENVLHECQTLCGEETNRIVVLYDVVYYYKIDEIASFLRSYFKEVILSQLDLTTNNLEDNSKNANVEELLKCGRIIQLPSDSSIENYLMLYIGEESLTQTNLFLTFNKNRFLRYSPRKQKAVWDNVNSNRTLKRRYYLVEKTKDAKIIGILVGTLGVKNYLSVISHLKQIIKVAGKRSYTLVVGKPNPAKLANFSEIDVFVLVACAENSLLESNEYYRPIVTPFELEVALNRSREWNGEYITDFTELIEGGGSYIPQREWDEQQQDVSLISGNLRSFGLSEQVVKDTVASQALEIRNEMKMAPLHNDGAGHHLASRSWKGLEQKLGGTPVSDAVEGRRGIAATYENELK